MAEPEQILDILEILTNAYPEKRFAKGTLQLYVEHLADIPSKILTQAVQDHIRTSKWFPRIAELRAIATNIAGGNPFETLAIDPLEHMFSEAFALEEVFFREDILFEEAWLSLADQFERNSRPHRAESIRHKLSAYQVLPSLITYP